MQEQWQDVLGFLRYSVSDHGRVRNNDTGRIMAIHRNPHGTCYVGLAKGKKQLRRSLPLLVATAFVPKMSGRVEFEKIIHLDGDQTNNRATNLAWRPHWFVVCYQNQFKRGPVGSDVPVMEVKTQELYPTTWDASLAFGLLEQHVIASATTGTWVFPTFSHFKYLAKNLPTRV